MAGWDMSKHPEWDMMYAAGLTAAEISRHTGAPRTTVQQHFVMREKYQPGTWERHKAALAAREQPWANTGWLSRLAEAQVFLDRNGRLPNPAGTAGAIEKTLAYWLRAQRQANTRGTLTPAKTATLAALGDWITPAGQAVKDAHWRDRLYDLQVWTATAGCFPRYARHSSEAERTLGVWLHIQTQHRSEHRLAPWRLQALDTAFPDGWHSHQ